MALNLVEKILKEHQAEGLHREENGEIGLKIDNTITQDSTGTLAYLQLETLDIGRIKTKVSVSFVDHNTLQTGFENADDHRYLQGVAAKYGLHFSRAGNGICHQVYLERFAVPGETLLGSDSHTPTAGAMAMLAIGAGGLNVAAAMAGQPYYIKKPRVCKVVLKGSLPPWVSAKDIILELLGRLSVKGGVGRIFEYTGEGVSNLTVPERATIANMGAELGATTSIFPSDLETKKFLQAQGREGVWRSLRADEGANYDEEIVIDLEQLQPLIAQPHSPDNVTQVKKIAGLKINQVFIGSCTNSSYQDLMKVAAILDGKSVHQDISLIIAPGSKQVLTMLADNGGLAKIINAGARILECTCGPCIGMGQAPESGGISLRTNNRNFPGRSGTSGAQVYLVSPEVAAVSAITGVLTDPREWGKPIEVKLPERFLIKDNLIIYPKEKAEKVEIVRGPNIVPLVTYHPLEDTIQGEVVLKVGNNITTDDIMPSNAKLLPYRSNIPYLGDFCFSGIDPQFPQRAKKVGAGIIMAGENYGQGSSREHAALVPRYLGIRIIIAKSFARIHFDNLINMGIIPLVFTNPDDYELLKLGSRVDIRDISHRLQVEQRNWELEIAGAKIIVKGDFSPRQRAILLKGGLLNYIKNTLGENHA